MIDRTDFDEAARLQGFCQAPWCGRGDGIWHPHHILEKKHLKARGLSLWDPRLALRVCEADHERHTNHARLLPLTCLPDEAIEAAFEILGAFAYDYLHRYYAGDDARVQAAFDILMDTTGAA